MPYIRLMTYAVIVLGLCACERDTYTTWNCSTPAEAKIPMVLKKAQMKFKGAHSDYCGSLGTQSYFAPKCSAQTEQSPIIFTPSSGLLINDGQEYQCTAL
jgi:hypothetical protein